MFQFDFLAGPRRFNRSRADFKIGKTPATCMRHRLAFDGAGKLRDDEIARAGVFRERNLLATPVRIDQQSVRRLADVAALESDTGYRPTTTVETGVARFVEWYRAYYQDPVQTAATTNAQIAAYTARARERGLAWAR